MMSPLSTTLAGLLCALLVIVIATIYYRTKNSRFRVLAAQLNGPPTLPLLGNLLDFGSLTSTVHEMFQSHFKLCARYPSGFFRVWFGPYLGVILTDPACVETVMASSEFKKSVMYELLIPVMGYGLVTASGDIWKQHRRIANHTFSTKILETFVDQFGKSARILVDKLAEHVDGAEFDIQHYFDLLALDIISETAMGAQLNIQHNSDTTYTRALLELETVALRRMTYPWLYNDFIWSLTGLYRRQKRAKKVVDQFINQVIQKNKEQLKQNAKNLTAPETGRTKPFLEYMLEWSENGTTLTDQEITDEVKTLMTAGYETSARLLSFLSFSLAMNQDIQERAVAEQKHLFGSDMTLPTFRQLSEMHYLDRVIREALRIYPTAPIIGRETQQEMNIGGKILPVGTNIGISIIAMHWDERLYPEPFRFDPDRFLPENIAQRHPCAYMPFSAGRRNCIGQRFAILEIKAAMSLVLRKYRLLPGSKTSIYQELTINIVLESVSGVHVKITERNKNKDV